MSPRVGCFRTPLPMEGSARPGGPIALHPGPLPGTLGPASGTVTGAFALARRLRRDRRGNAAAEFAMILPAFLAMFAAVIQYGSMFVTYNTMLNGAREAAREVAVGKSNHGNASTKAKGKRPQWVSAGSYAVVTQDLNANEVQSTITVPGEEATVLPILPVPAQLTATVVMDKEG